MSAHGEARRGLTLQKFMNIRKNTSELYSELQRIAKANGGELTPQAVLKNARAKSSPLHSHFTWDDGEAAERYRIMEASFLIRRVKVTVETHDQDAPVTVRAFVNVKTTEADEDGVSPCGVYVPLHTALNSQDYKQQMLENAARELAAFRNKYSVLKELASVFSAVESFQQTLRQQQAA